MTLALEAAGQTLFCRTREGMSVVHMVHTTTHIPVIYLHLPWYQWDFLMHRCNDALAHSEKARMCTDYLTNSRSLLFALIQAWNLGVFFKQIEITAQIIAVLSAQDFSNTLQTTCKHLPKESFACIPSLTAYQT